MIKCRIRAGIGGLPSVAAADGAGAGGAALHGVELADQARPRVGVEAAEWRGRGFAVTDEDWNGSMLHGQPATLKGESDLIAVSDDAAIWSWPTFRPLVQPPGEGHRAWPGSALSARRRIEPKCPGLFSRLRTSIPLWLHFR